MGGVGGYKHTCKGIFAEFANPLPKSDPNNPAHAEDLRYRQGINPGLMRGATSNLKILPACLNGNNN